MFCCPLAHRGVLYIHGHDTLSFLQGLVTNDVKHLPRDGWQYNCLLTPQGKFLHDFLVTVWRDGVLLLPEKDRMDDLLSRLRRFCLRSAVEFTVRGDWPVWVSSEPLAFAGNGLCASDPRHTALGYVTVTTTAPAVETAPLLPYENIRIRHAIPDGSRDMLPEQAILLENNIDALHGIDWNKGCYMGQELTARTRYRALIRKKLLPVFCPEGAPQTGAVLYAPDGKEAGWMRSSADDRGLALLREDYQAVGTRLTDEQGLCVRVDAVPQ